jgi:hypothetical protein
MGNNNNKLNRTSEIYGKISNNPINKTLEIIIIK